MLQDEMTAGPQKPERPSTIKRLKISVMHATLDGGLQRNEGIAVKIRESVSVTMHISIRDDDAEEHR